MVKRSCVGTWKLSICQPRSRQCVSLLFYLLFFRDWNAVPWFNTTQFSAFWFSVTRTTGNPVYASRKHLVIDCFEENNDKRIIAAITVYFQTFSITKSLVKDNATVVKSELLWDLRVRRQMHIPHDMLFLWKTENWNKFDEANREAILTSLSVDLTLLSVNWTYRLFITCRYRLVNNL